MDIRNFIIRTVFSLGSGYLVMTVVGVFLCVMSTGSAICTPVTSDIEARLISGGFNITKFVSLFGTTGIVYYITGNWKNN